MPAFEAHDSVALDQGWRVAGCEADAFATPADTDALAWRPAQVPGTAAGALMQDGTWTLGEPFDFDGRDWWFETYFDAGPVVASEQVLLHFDGIATVADAFLNDELLLESDSMFAAHTVDVSDRLRGANRLSIRCRALEPLLAIKRKPRQRWRTRIVSEPNLRFFRTMLLGRAPGFAAGPAAVGPYRGVRLERRRGLAVDRLEAHPRIDGEDGLLELALLMHPLDGVAPQQVRASLAPVDAPADDERHRVLLSTSSGDAGRLEARGLLRVPRVRRWWPHTHGEPQLYELRVEIDRAEAQTIVLVSHRVGFRDLSFGDGATWDLARDGLSINVNGIPVFARGAVWPPLDVVNMSCADGRLRQALEIVCDAGMNMVRLPGTGAYESARFHDLCDELGLLVWQDMMFANFDYPTADRSFLELAADEAREVLGKLAGRPSLAVLCGNSEVEQQAAMLGLDPELGRNDLFGSVLPAVVQEAGADAIYIPSAPFGEGRPFRTDTGVANYYGLGGYRLSPEDARRSELRFAAECLAFANVPDQSTIEAFEGQASGSMVVHHPRWKAGVPRDVGAGWDFDDVRDHYFGSILDLDPGELRRFDHERYLELSRALTGELMAGALGEWRRPTSRCAGALILWMHDLAPGAGWGLLDHLGVPKVAYHHVRRALAPVAVWMTDEGCNGMNVHVCNDRGAWLRGRLRVALYRDHETLVAQADEQIEVPPNGSCLRDVEEMLERFVDVSWTYRFGPPAQDTVVASLESDDVLVSQAFGFPAGRPTRIESADAIGLSARGERLTDGSLRLHVETQRLVWGVRVHVAGFVAEDDAFCVEPGARRELRLLRTDAEADLRNGTLTALNLDGRIRIDPPSDESPTA